MSNEPYYNDGQVCIFHGSCLDITLWTRAGMLITDPPYGMNHISGWKKRPIVGDETVELRDKVLDLWEPPKPALVFGRWNIPHPVRAKMCLTWNKGDWPGMGDLKLPWGPSTEEIYVIGRDFVGKRSGSVVYANRIVGKAARHPTEKPVELLEQLIEKCNPDLTIADPFLGSGTTLVAAKKLGRNAIGIEMDEAYCELAAIRLEELSHDQ